MMTYDDPHGISLGFNRCRGEVGLKGIRLADEPSISGAPNLG